MSIKGVKPISEIPEGKLVVTYGRSGSGKTWFGGTFPKPLLLIKIGDDGGNTIKEVEDVYVKEIENASELKVTLKECLKDDEYKTVFVDTFSLIVNEWKDENILSKSKRMTQQAWGDLATDTEECVRLAHKLSKSKWVVLSCHEVVDTIDGMEDELLPDVRCSVSKGVRTYLEGMANYGIHTVKIQKEVENPKTGETELRVRFAADIGPNPYYWTKLQVNPSVKVPKRLINPTFDKLMSIVNKE